MTGELLDISAPLPQDLADSLAALGDPREGRVADVDGRML